MATLSADTDTDYMLAKIYIRALDAGNEAEREIIEVCVNLLAALR